jgi:hypothetical protein
MKPYCLFFDSHSVNLGDPHSKRTYRPKRTQGMRSSFGVRARVWFRIQDSGTFQRFASSAESINSAAFPLLRDINGTSAVSRFMFPVT